MEQKTSSSHLIEAKDVESGLRLPTPPLQSAVAWLLGEGSSRTKSPMGSRRTCMSSSGIMGCPAGTQRRRRLACRGAAGPGHLHYSGEKLSSHDFRGRHGIRNGTGGCGATSKAGPKPSSLSMAHGRTPAPPCGARPLKRRAPRPLGRFPAAGGPLPPGTPLPTILLQPLHARCPGARQGGTTVPLL